MRGITLTLAMTIVSTLALPRLLESAEGEIVPTFDAIADTAFLLFTRRNPTNSQLLHISDMNVIRNSFFDSGRPTRFLIHGMFGNRNSALNTIVQPALLQAGDFNVIVVDWGEGALTNVMVNARFVGAALAYFLDNLQNAGLMNFNQLTLIGHSMGAHISGFAGKKIRGRINTIIGLDAADVGDINDPSTRIDAGDAEYVELIQTEIVFWGIPAPIGHANFYPAGGTSQPNCGGSQVCDHMIAIDYFAESLSTPNRFYAQRCLNMDQMRANACPSSSTDYLMGGSTSNQNRNLRGIFRLPVNAQRPFAVGRV
ncbi:pancreatic lipase-related protein 2-like [Bradysia coprophila]|uniref:pancreatic lipase-related protein 2-like n=1 Tax=Bradysia coprophila TaxID=38358 RepID=UPI00187DD6E6|nr:pancreatic lipase-related protein 2-like [Bradysia coprophila]